MNRRRLFGFLGALIGGTGLKAIAPAVDMVRPPLVVYPVLKNEPLSIMPGMITFVNTAHGNGGFKPAFEVLPWQIKA